MYSSLDSNPSWFWPVWELIFFLVEGAMLYFGFIMTIMLIRHWWFWLLLSWAYPEPRISQFSLMCHWENAEGGREHDQDTWAELARRRFHPSCPVYKLGGAGQEVLVTAWGWAGHWPAGGEQLCNASLALLRSYSSLSLCCLPFHYYYYTILF